MVTVPCRGGPDDERDSMKTEWWPEAMESWREQHKDTPDSSFEVDETKLAAFGREMHEKVSESLREDGLL